MNRIVVVFDNSIQPCHEIKNIIGNKSFKEVIFKRKSLGERYYESLNVYNFIQQCFEVENLESYYKIIENINNLPNDIAIVHIYLTHVIKNIESFDNIIEKAKFIKENIIIEAEDKSIGMILFNSREDYINFLKYSQISDEKNEAFDFIKGNKIFSDAFANLNNVSSFLKFITGGFDARFFNSLKGDEYTVTKSSTNKVKIKSEYTFYHLIPDSMKMWFVLPYNYQETDKTASYTMERLSMTDVAIRWVHGAISLNEFERLIKRLFFFINSRTKKNIDKEKYDTIAHGLYLNKLDKRIDELKKNELFPKFLNFIKYATNYQSIDEIVNKYKTLYNKYFEKVTKDNVSVIGHGDLCFSNMLYNNETSTLKLIDTKGALEESQIWTDPYYDIAKLSHSICGKYDFFNSGMYEIELGLDLKFNLTIDFDNSKYVEIFKKYLKQSGYDYKMIRILEASLFLSMLPLHMDIPQKVFGFLLNAINILEEIENV